MVIKILLAGLLCLLALPAWADIYKCKDSNQKLVYQDTPCEAKTLGKIEPIRAPSRDETLQAKRDLDRMIEGSRYYDQRRQEEWKLKQEELRLLEAQEQRELERQQAAERATVYIPAYGYPYGRRPHHHRFPQPSFPSTPKPKHPCVIGYVGDKSCR